MNRREEHSISSELKSLGFRESRGTVSRAISGGFLPVSRLPTAVNQVVPRTIDVRPETMFLGRAFFIFEKHLPV